MTCLYGGNQTFCNQTKEAQNCRKELSLKPNYCYYTVNYDTKLCLITGEIYVFPYSLRK